MHFHAGVSETPDVADLAGLHEVVERRIVSSMGVWSVPDVQPVEVDVVGLQATERLLAGGDDSPCGWSRRRWGRRHVMVAAELGGDDESVALLGVATEVVADDLLGVALGVEVGGVDEVAAALDEAIDDLFRVGDAAAPPEVFAERHGAEAKGADTKTGTTERDIVIERHIVFL